MQKVKKLLRSALDNMTELWLGLLLFVGLPIVAGLYFDYRAALATSLLLQTTVLTLVIYKGNK